jgi:hypothetical protein
MYYLSNDRERRGGTCQANTRKAKLFCSVKFLETTQTAEGYKLEDYHALYLFLDPAPRGHVCMNNRAYMSLVFHIIYIDKFCTSVCNISGIHKTLEN